MIPLLDCSKPALPSLLLANIRGLRSNFTELSLVAASHTPTILSLTETWLDDTVQDSCISLPGYLLFRKDRLTRRGGGVCAYVHAGTRVSLMQNTPAEPEFCEGLWLHLPVHKLILLLLYLPPNLLREQQKCVTKYILQNSDSLLASVNACYLMICGDLNTYPTSDLESTLGLTQLVEGCTRGSSLLDKVLIDSSQADLYKKPLVGPCIGTSDHQIVLLHSTNCKDSYTKKYVEVYDYREDNIARFLCLLDRVNWSKMYHLSHDDFEAKCSFFYENFHNARSSIPCTVVEMKNSDKPWVTPLLKHMINKRFQAYRSKDFSLYNHLKVKVKKEISKAKLLWSNKLLQQKQGIWKMTSTMFNKKAPQQTKLSNLLLDFESPDEAANAINKVFSNVFSASNLQNSANVPLQVNSSESCSWKPDLTPSTICAALAKLDCRKSSGSDGIPPLLLKMSRRQICQPLSHLFNRSVELGYLPMIWKFSLVVPVPKKNLTTINDLRPISLLPIVSKVLEALVLQSIKPRLLELYGNEQFGFRPSSSTLLAHLATHDFITQSLEFPNITGVLLASFDMSKAFDRVPHDSIIDLLQSHSFPRSFIQWCVSYFQGRSQCVMVGNAVSAAAPVTSGVPQGSILGPYIFNASIGSLTTVRHSTKLIKYADDILLLIPFSSLSDADEVFKEESANIQEWCKNANLLLNDKKTQLMIVSKKSIEPLPPSLSGFDLRHNLTLLGVTFDSKLSWKPHVKATAKKAAQRIYPLKQLKRFSNITKAQLVKVYNSFILSVLEYNSPLFVGISLKNSTILERVRKRCHRVICGYECRLNCLESLSDRRLKKSLSVFKATLQQSHILHHLSPKVLRHSLSVPLCKTQRRSKSFFPLCTKMYNSSRM